jgi:hypothetical protein
LQEAAKGHPLRNFMSYFRLQRPLEIKEGQSVLAAASFGLQR